MIEVEEYTKSDHTAGKGREQMNVVVIGHVDHGKSTLVGRLLADTGSLPEGKLEAVRANCARNSKPFEYAFLLDALKDEQTQGITIDSARCFFHSSKREYIIIDVPGHIEFLKNMISGAARAEAALLVIDAKEGIRENSKRHGYLLSMLGIGQIAVAVNKMDLVDYSQVTFERIVGEYSAFLAKIGLSPKCFIPVSAREGDNVIGASRRMLWYEGPDVLQTFDSFEKEPPNVEKALRLPVQDIYKFTESNDDRRIMAGRIETGTVKVGDEVIFLPSQKKSRIAAIEGFNTPRQVSVSAGRSTGFTLETQVYIKPGEMMCKTSEQRPMVSSRIRANIFWLGTHPMVKGKRYKMKIAGARVAAWLRRVNSVLDTTELAAESNREQIERHDVAECVLVTFKPVAFDLAHEIAQTSRFVIIDNYEIAGGGIITGCADDERSMIEEHVQRREKNWQRSALTTGIRCGRYGQRSALVVITGPTGAGKAAMAKALEAHLFNCGRLVYYLGISNSELGIDADLQTGGQRDEQIRRLGEMAHLFTDAGVILITTVSDLDDYELEVIESLNKPNECVVVNVGENRLNKRVADLETRTVADHDEAIKKIKEVLQTKNYLIEYYV